MYLDREAVESTLRKIAGTATGVVVAFDYFSAEIIEARSLFMRYARAVINATGEPWRFGIDNTPPVKERVAAFLESCRSLIGGAAQLRAGDGPEARYGGLRHRDRVVCREPLSQPGPHLCGP
jgi:O-methyltransferase involved in polyketide biosynthesis